MVELCHACWKYAKPDEAIGTLRCTSAEKECAMPRKNAIEALKYVSSKNANSFLESVNWFNVF